MHCWQISAKKKLQKNRVQGVKSPRDQAENISAFVLEPLNPGILDPFLSDPKWKKLSEGDKGIRLRAQEASFFPWHNQSLPTQPISHPVRQNG